MSSPFQTSQEFLEVKGPLYTFANSPFWLILFLVFSVVIFFWFIYASYRINGSKSSASDPAMLSVLILTGFLSLAQSVYVSSANKIEAYYRQKNKSEVFLGKKTTTVPKRIVRRTSATPRNYYSRRPDRNSTIRRS